MKYKIKEYILYYWTFIQMALGIDKYNSSKRHPNAISAIRAIIIFIWTLAALVSIVDFLRRL